MKLLFTALVLLTLWAPVARSQITLISTGSVWKYSAQGTDLRSDWRVNTFDDSSWASGTAQLGWGDGDERTVLVEGPPFEEAPLTTYYRKRFIATNYIYTLTLRLLRDDGVIVYLNEQEVARENMPPGEVGFHTAATRVIESDEGKWIQFGVFPDPLRNGENVLAVEVHQASGSPGWGDCSFDLELVANLPQARPTVAITAPANGATIPAGIFQVAADAHDADGHIARVEYFLNGAMTEVAYEPPFTADLNAGPGRHVLRAVAYDNTEYSRASLRSYFQVGDPLPVTLLRGPYLQSGSSTSMVVRWRTDWPTNSVVHFGSNPDALEFTTISPLPTNEHQVVVTGLSPDTKYYYQVGSSGEIFVAGPEYSFRTSPTNARPVRVWVLGDAGKADTHQMAVRDAYVNFSVGQTTDFMMMLGDNAYESGTDDEYQAALFEMYPEQLSQMVLWPALGNHEINLPDEFSYPDIFSLPTAGESGGVASGSELYYSFDYANVHFICLDSQISSRATNGPMLSWLKADLAATEKDWIVAFFHHPPYSFGSHQSDNDTQLGDVRRSFLPILEQHGVDLVLAGHSHSYERSFLVNGHYGLSPTLTSAMVLDQGAGRPSGPYRKPSGGLGAGRGTVYAVCGCSGEASDLPFALHPVMATNYAGLGSMALDFNGLRLTGQFVNEAGLVLDSFVIDKSQPATLRPRLAIVRDGNGMRLTWPTSNPSYTVETSPLVSTNLSWQQLAAEVMQTGRVRAATVNMDGTNRFFRLRTP
jgi:hypothetical protein